MPFADAPMLEHVTQPVLLVENGMVRFANAAARSILGSHVVGQDVRIAIRIPEAIAAITAPEGGTVRISGLSVPGSQWDLACHSLGNDRKMIVLEDLSVRVGVARAHADFVANASHELRTPLAAVLGYVETLEDDKAGGDPDTRKRFLGIIRHEAQRMQALVEDLMSLSRIEAVKHDTPTEPVDIVALAREAAGEVQNRAEVRLSTNCDSAMVAGDRGQLAQVLRNLVDNAIKYGKPGNPVHIDVETSTAGRVAISIRDEGEGIAPEHLPRLTERFYRVDTGRSRAAGGTGLGLAIVKHIAERHRGWFDISSRSGQGTTATVILPLLLRDE
ncbi:cell wall metabolism sensor histidine kinase WalK [Novosphingobium sp. TH158]|uniref:sensor histidine kinase n=1 Tax=Novosphingobium sp. TH158 TaxID=2067455 RepID=UPI000C7A6A89|nr:ATP-binding protein [Novosphingobium sp. TH158]PLK26472.1 two-component sensor histidine kinase [Novosphingobium sp. TH158]